MNDVWFDTDNWQQVSKEEAERRMEAGETAAIHVCILNDAGEWVHTIIDASGVQRGSGWFGPR
jgi:hypothetical protein